MYGFTTTIEEDFDQLLDRVVEALGNEGFGVLTDINVQATLEAKLGVAMPAYRILGACSPPLANQALQAEPDIGLLLPCNVVVRQLDDASVKVAFMDPESVLSMVDQPGVTELAGEVRQRLERVRDALGGDYGSC